jgi:hypothetical protein
MKKYIFIFLAIAIFNSVVLMIRSTNSLDFALAGSIAALCGPAALLVKLVLDKSN